MGGGKCTSSSQLSYQGEMGENEIFYFEKMHPRNILLSTKLRKSYLQSTMLSCGKTAINPSFPRKTKMLLSTSSLTVAAAPEWDRRYISKVTILLPPQIRLGVGNSVIPLLGLDVSSDRRADTGQTFPPGRTRHPAGNTLWTCTTVKYGESFVGPGCDSWTVF